MERGREAQPDNRPRIIDQIERYEKREGPELQTHFTFRPLPDSPPSFNPPCDGTLTCNLQGDISRPKVQARSPSQPYRTLPYNSHNLGVQLAGSLP